MKKNFPTTVKLTFYLFLTLTVMLQAANREFKKHTFNFNSISVDRRGSPAITDFNGDGILDLIIGDRNGKLFYYKQDALNDSNFTLQSPQYLKDNLGNDINAGLFCSPIFYDIDNDGLIDLLISGRHNDRDKIFHYEQTSSGAITFTQLSEHFVTPDDGRNSFAFADIDGDGLIGLFVGKYNGTISYYEQDSTNSYSFSLITNKFNNIDIGYNSNPTITDFFNDGILDLVIGKSSSDNLIYYKQGAANSTTFNHVTDDFLSEVNSAFSEFLIPYFYDIDGDGLLDLLIGDSEGTTTNISKIAWYEAPIAKTNYIYFNDQATATTADGGGEIFVDLADNVTERGVCWSTSPMPTISDSRTSDGTGVGTFSSLLTGLTQGTHYYMRAYATNNGITNYGNEREFDTDDTPTVTIVRVYNIQATSAKVESDVDENGDDITERGVCWNTTGSPVKTDSRKSVYIGGGTQYTTVTGLNSGTTYYVRAYATNSLGTSYSNEETFTTNGTPTVTTNTTVSNITATSATSGGDAVNNNGESITEKGVCWSTTQDPTISDTHTSDGTGTGAFTSSITGLTKGTTYYIRAYATNSVGTGYGDNVSFTTNGPPTVTVDTTVTDITATSATSSGEVTDNNGESVTARGVCWSTSQNPTTADSHTTDGTGTGIFASSITGLLQGTTYNIRTYATNSLGTSYSDNVSFTTDDIPSVSSTDVHSIGVTTAIFKGNVTSDNGDNVTERGVCWSTSANPTIADSYSSSGSGEGEFDANISGLTRDTKYYARAYATNSLGTSYGDNIEFTTRFQLRNMLNFDGIDDYVSTSLSLPIPGTIELWVKFNNTGDQTIFQNYSGSNYAWTFMVANGGHILAYTSVANKLESTTVISPGKWYHIALTWSKYLSVSGNYKLAVNFLINGNSEATNPEVHIDNPGTTFTIGSRNNQTNFLNGQIDELRIWSVEKTEAQIQGDMHKDVDPSDTDLFCYYNFDIADGTSLSDNTANNNVGTLYNMLDEDWQIATDPCGDYGTSVRTDSPTSTGAVGKTLTVDISSSVDASNCLGIYSWGDGNTSINGETYPAGITQRINLAWGIEKYGNITADVVFDYSSVDGITDPASLKLLKRTNSNSAWNDITSSAVHNTTNRTFSMSGLTSFSEFSIADDGANPVPVQLKNFAAKSFEGKIILNWSTATEVNNYGFDIQRSVVNSQISENNWEVIGFIEGHGNSNSQNDYSFIDTNPQGDTIKYRLKQIDFGGAVKYSNIVEIKIDLPINFKLAQNFPNPFNPTTIIKYRIPEESNVNIEIYNMLGERIAVLINKKIPAGYYETVWNASNLPSGVYLINIEAEGINSNISFRKVRKAVLLK